MFFISCTDDNYNLSEAKATVVFTSNTTRSIGSGVVGGTAIKPYYWTYSAVKLSDTEFCLGATASEKAVSLEKGLDKEIGPFNIGKWEFTLNAYQIYDSNTDSHLYKVYSFPVKATLSEGVNEININAVSMVQTEEGKGTLVIGDNLKINNIPYSSSYTEKIEYLDGENAWKELGSKTTTLASGKWRIRVSYLKDSYTITSSTIDVDIYDNLTTYIYNVDDQTSGNIDVDPENSGIITSTSDAIIVDPTKETNLSVNTSSKVNPEKENIISVSIPAENKFETGTAVLSVKTYDEKSSIASEEFKVSEESVAIAGFDITVKDGDSAKTEFISDITVTAYIPKGLNDVKVIYDGNPLDQAKYNYDGTTGLLCFKTNHLSLFYVETTYSVINETTNTAYDTFANAYQAANANDKLLILKNIKSDLTLDKDIALVGAGSSPVIPGDKNRAEKANDLSKATTIDGKITIKANVSIENLYIYQNKENDHAIILGDNGNLRISNTFISAEKTGVRVEGKGSSLDVIGSSINGKYYGIGVRDYNDNISVLNSTLSGWAGLMTSAGDITVGNDVKTTISINNSNLYSYPIRDGFYGALVLQEKYNGVALTIENSTLAVLKDKSLTDKTIKKTHALEIRSYGNSINILNSELKAVDADSDFQGAVVSLGFRTEWDAPVEGNTKKDNMITLKGCSLDAGFGDVIFSSLRDPNDSIDNITVDGKAPSVVQRFVKPTLKIDGKYIYNEDAFSQGEIVLDSLLDKAVKSNKEGIILYLDNGFISEEEKVSRVSFKITESIKLPYNITVMTKGPDCSINGLENIEGKGQLIFENGWLSVADTSWYKDELSNFEIKSPEELAGLALLVNSGTDFKEKTIKLVSDIDLDAKYWTPIGFGPRGNRKSGDSFFSGTFDGNNKTISNMKISFSALTADNDTSLGLFSRIDSAIIKDLTVKDAVIVGNTNTAGVAVGFSIGSSKIQNVTAENCKVTSFQGVGIVGRLYCYNEADLPEVIGCKNIGCEFYVATDSINNVDTNAYNAAGIIGCAKGENKLTPKFTISDNSVDLSTNGFIKADGKVAAGIVATFQSCSKDTVFKNNTITIKNWDCLSKNLSSGKTNGSEIVDVTYYNGPSPIDSSNKLTNLAYNT